MAINVKWSPASYLATDVVKVRPVAKNAAGVAVVGSAVAQTTGDAGALNVPQTGYSLGQEFIVTVTRGSEIIAQSGIRYREPRELPGGENIIIGDEELGYYGVVNTDLIGIAPTLAKTLNRVNHYQKLAYKGKIIYVPFFVSTSRPVTTITLTMQEIWNGGYAKKVETPSWASDETYGTAYRDIGDGLRTRMKFIHHNDDGLLNTDEEVFKAFRPAFVNTHYLEPDNPNYVCLPTRRNEGSAGAAIPYVRAEIRSTGYFHESGNLTTGLVNSTSTLSRLSSTEYATSLVNNSSLPTFWYIEVYKA